MKPFTKVTGLVAPLARANVDTDQIIPKQFLKSIRRTGFGDNLFDAWRYLDEGEMGQTQNERRINHEFVLNAPRYQDARVLLAGPNFGCGSSREHAVWALSEYGFCCAIGSSFADIFHNNCFKNGFLPIVLDEEIVETLFQEVAVNPGYELTVDLAQQAVTTPDGKTYPFDIEPHRKQALLEGLDEIGFTLTQADKIRTFEQAHAAAMPWVFRGD